MDTQVRDGWLVVPYGGDDLATVHIAVGNDAQVWIPAFLDYVDGQRVAKVRARVIPERPTWVWLRINGDVTKVGNVRRT